MTPARAGVALALILTCGSILAAADSPRNTRGAGARTEVVTDSTVLARVDGQPITGYDFRSSYFASDPETHPSADSAGRAKFLSILVDKQVLSLTARASNPPLKFEDRATLRDYTDGLLAQMMYQRHVLDPAQPTPDQIQAGYAQYQYDLRLRYLLFTDRAQAERIRSELLRHRLTWQVAAAKYSIGPDSLVKGDLGWMARQDLHGLIGTTVFGLAPGAWSPVLSSDDGFQVWQCLERRPAAQQFQFAAIKQIVRQELVSSNATPLQERFFETIRQRAQGRYDTTNVLWLAARFAEANRGAGSATAAINLISRAPKIAPADTSRVLATTSNGRFTIADLMTEFRELPSFLRRKITGSGAMWDVVRRMVLEPFVVDAARAEGLEHDPRITAQVAHRREGLQVERMYQDSVMTRVRISESERRKYYAEHQREFVSRERVVYAVIPRYTQAGADSVLRAFKAGVPVPTLVAADSTAGVTSSRIRELLEGQSHDYRAILFEELRPGQSTIVGGADSGVWVVLSVLRHDASRAMAYDEVRDIVDESAQNIEAERQLAVWTARLRRGHRIEMHPELAARLTLTDPAADPMN